MKLRQKILHKIMNLYPPFLGAGIKVDYDPGEKRVLVSMKLRFYNRNYVGTHYGGSLYSMCDPFYMVLLIDNLGRDYVVWDKRASIEFKKPGRGTVTAEFFIPGEKYREIRERADRDGKVEEEFTVHVTDEKGEIVATVTKLLSIRRKDRR